MNRPSIHANEDNAAIWPELWDAFATHRRTILQLLHSVSRQPKGDLCVWGAGRTSDLDLIPLSTLFDQIDLVDLRSEVTKAALVQRGFVGNPVVSLLPSTDLTGLSHVWKESKPRSIEQTIDAIAKEASETVLPIRKYDVVISTCLLSQIIRHAVETLQPANIDEQQMASVVRILREQHIRLLLAHTQPGGIAILVTDMTSSEALPELLSQPEATETLMNKVIQGNHFHGLHPQLIVETLKRQQATGTLAGFSTSKPWVWDSIDLKYLTMAFQLKKAG